MKRSEKAKEWTSKVNDLLKKDKSLNVTQAREILGYKKTTFNDLIRGLYIYDKWDREYRISQDFKFKKEKIEEETNEEETNEEYKKDTETIQGLILSLEQQEELIKILQGKNNIEIPKAENEDFKTPIRVNDVVWKKFSKLCNDHKNYSKKDHLTLALIKYINDIETDNINEYKYNTNT